MNKQVFKLLSIVLILIIVDVLLCIRYHSWGSGLGELIPFISLVVIAEALTVYSFYQFKQIINPFSVYSLFIYIAGFSFLRISDKQESYSPTFVGILTCSIIFFILGGYLAQKSATLSLRNRIPKLSIRLSLLFLIAVFLMGIFVFILEIRQLGYLPLMNLGVGSVYNDLNENEVTPLHNFIVLNSVLPAIFFIIYKKKGISFWWFLSLSLVCGFIILNFFSRQIIMLFFFSLIIAVSYYKKVPVFKLLLVGIGTIVLFIGLGALRDNSTDSADSNTINDFLKEYNAISKPTNILETYLSLYGAVNFSTANKLTDLAIHDRYLSYGAYTLRPLITVLPIDKSSIYPAAYSSYAMLGTYVVDPFLDFRWFGVIFLNSAYGFFSMNSFKNYLAHKDEYYIVEWSIFMFCLFMCSFTNFFHMFFVLFFLIVNRIALK
jgi:oligosaccharide repeat unit polymerase